MLGVEGYSGDSGQLLVSVIIAAILAFIPAFIAKGKGREFALWYVYGLLLWIVAFIHSMLLKPTPASVPPGTAPSGGVGAIPPMPGGAPPLPPPPPTTPLPPE